MSSLRKLVEDFRKNQAAGQMPVTEKLPYPWEADLPAGAVVADQSSLLVRGAAGSIRLFEEKIFSNPGSELGDITYYLYDPTLHGFPAGGNYPISVWLHGLACGAMGKINIPMTGAGTFASDKYQQELGGMYIIVPIANEFVEPWCEKYVDPLTKLIAQEREALGTSGKLILCGTSMGGRMITHLLESNLEITDGVFWMSPALLPDRETVERYGKAGLHMWLLWGLHDEVITSPEMIFPNGPEEYRDIPNLDLTLLEWVYNGDGSIASSQGYGQEQGQHATNLQAIRNYIREDGTPDDPLHPMGLSGWMLDVLKK